MRLLRQLQATARENATRDHARRTTRDGNTTHRFHVQALELPVKLLVPKRDVTHKRVVAVHRRTG